MLSREDAVASASSTIIGNRHPTYRLRSSYDDLPTAEKGSKSSHRGVHEVPISHCTESRLELRRSDSGRSPSRRNQFQDDGIQACTRPLPDWGDPRLRWSDRRIQLPMGVGNWIFGWPGGFRMCLSRRRSVSMDMLFLSMRASHRTVVFLTGMRGSSIR